MSVSLLSHKQAAGVINRSFPHSTLQTLAAGALSFILGSEDYSRNWTYGNHKVAAQNSGPIKCFPSSAYFVLIFCACTTLLDAVEVGWKEVKELHNVIV